MRLAIVFGKLIAPIVRCKPSADRAEGPKRGRRQPRRAAAETLERRCLLSAYTLSQIGYLWANGTGANPQSTLVADSAGDLYGTTPYGGAYGVGTVFEIAKGSTTVTTLASFSSTDRSNPIGGVAVDAAGNLYGTTPYGGTDGKGTVFEIANGSATLTTLASFNNTNGANPYAGVTLDSAGNLYGTTQGGGASFVGTVFEIAKGSTTVTTLASFSYTNGATPMGGVTLDADGNLYGTTSVGGPGSGGTVFEIANGSTAVTMLGFFNGTNGGSPAAGVTMDAAGNLYGTTQTGGANEQGTVFEIAKGSTTITTLASFNSANGLYPDADVTLDSAGDLYGTTYGTTSTVGTNGLGTVFEIVKGSTTVTTLASFNSSNGADPYGGVTLDAAGTLYGTTEFGGVSNAGTVFEFAKGSVQTLASFDATNGGFPHPGVTLDAAGNLYGTTSVGGVGGMGTIFEIAKGSTTATTLASFNGTNGGDPSALTLDATGNLYGTTVVGGPANDGTVFEISKGSTTLTVLASFNGKNGANPYGGVTLDAAGNLYGTTFKTFNGGADGAGTVFEIPKGSTAVNTLALVGDITSALTLDAAGNLYGTTQSDGPGYAGTVFEIPKGSTTVSTLASFNGANGADPSGVTLDADGNLYGTTSLGGDTGDGTVFEVVKGSTTVTTLVSFNGANGGGPDGGVTLDASGNLYGTTDGGGTSNFGTVFEISKGSTTVTTLTAFKGINGISPFGGIALDSSGNLYGTTVGGGASGYGTIFKLTPAIPGDANGDGKVDFADLLILARNYGMTNATWSDGDFNGDGTVGFDDLVILARNYGKTTTAAATNMAAAAATRAAALAPSLAPGTDDQSKRLARAGRHRR